MTIVEKVAHVVCQELTTKEIVAFAEALDGDELVIEKLIEHLADLTQGGKD